MSQDRPFIMLKPLEPSWVSGNHQGKVNSVSQADEVSNMTPARGQKQGVLSKGIMASDSTSICEKADPPELTLKLENLTPPICPWHL